MRITDMITQVVFAWYFINLSPLLLQYILLYCTRLQPLKKMMTSLLLRPDHEVGRINSRDSNCKAISSVLIVLNFNVQLTNVTYCK